MSSDNNQHPRRLAAILLMDVVGYSRHVEVDEEGTLARLQDVRVSLLDPIIADHNGRTVKLMGDGALIEHASVVDAVRCALEIQRAMAKGNAEVPEGDRIELRIGINLGDIVADGSDIYGDGVNVAARLESMAEPGGICVSGTAYDQVKQKVEAGYEYLGEQQVKNLAEPVRVYRVLVDPEAAGRFIDSKRSALRRWKGAGIAAALVVVVVGGYTAWTFQRDLRSSDDVCQRIGELEVPDRPSVAVLPFDVFGSESDVENLGDIVSEAIITTLAKVPDLFVIARNSTDTYKGKSVKVQDVAEDLGVRYVVEGSIQRDGDLMRVTAQLIDSETEHHIWAESFDREAGKSFDIMDEISFRVLNALEINLTEGEQARLRGRGTDNLKAYQLYMQALKEQVKLNAEANANALELARQATELDPDFWGGWTALAYASTTRYWFGSADKSESFRSGLEYANKALELGGESNPDANLALNFIETWRGNYEEAIAFANKAVDLSPNMADAWGHLGMTYLAAGRPGDAIPVTKNAMRLSPYYSNYLLFNLAKAYRYTGRHEEAIPANLELICRSPDSVFTYRDLALSYGALGQDKEAREAVTKLLEIQPDYTLRDYIDEGDTGIDPETREQNVGILRRSGLPE